MLAVGHARRLRGPRRAILAAGPAFGPGVFRDQDRPNWPITPGRPAGADAQRLGWGVTRRYGLIALKPFGNLVLASSSETAGTMITS